MAFLNRVTSLVKNTVSKNVTSELFAPSSSPFQAIRSFSSSKLFVGGLSYTTDEASLREEFSKYGEVTEAPYHTPRARASHFPVVHSKYVPFMRYELFSSTASTAESGEGNKENQKINVTFVDKDGEEAQIKVPVGMSMLEAAHENDLDLEGACEGSLACSTCHVIVMDVEQYNKLPDPTDEENDMLDLAFGLTETSRLGCQIIAEPELEGLRLAIPSATRNFAVDGFKPKPH